MEISVSQAAPSVFQEAYTAVRDIPTFSGIEQISKENFISDLSKIIVLRSFLEAVTKIYLKDKMGTLTTYPFLGIVDNTLKGYLQDSEWETKCRLFWLIKKIDETISFLKFRIARARFIELMEDTNLSSVIFRINNQATEVEAGVYSLRDVKNILKEIDKKLQVSI